jgi:uncharacterized protein
MTKIGLLSDTHGKIYSGLFNFFKDCNQIWHAGDIGNLTCIEELKKIGQVVAVSGNIDDNHIKIIYPEHQRFHCEDTDVWLTHIGGYPAHYHKHIIKTLLNNPPDLFICGHSHILKIIYDKQFNMLHINPGAAGKTGIHQICTAIRFDIDKKEIKNLEILEYKKDAV